MKEKPVKLSCGFNIKVFNQLIKAKVYIAGLYTYMYKQ